MLRHTKGVWKEFFSDCPLREKHKLTEANAFLSARSRSWAARLQQQVSDNRTSWKIRQFERRSRIQMVQRFDLSNWKMMSHQPQHRKLRIAGWTRELEGAGRNENSSLGLTETFENILRPISSKQLDLECGVMSRLDYIVGDCWSNGWYWKSRDLKTKDRVLGYSHHGDWMFLPAIPENRVSPPL